MPSVYNNGFGSRYKVKMRARYDGRGADWTDIMKAVVMVAPAANNTPLTATNTPLPTATNTPLPTANTPVPTATINAGSDCN